MFEAGDAIVHPVRGAGVVTEVIERKRDGEKREYYRIELMSHPETTVMIPSGATKELGLRRAISQSKIKKLWHILLDDPEKLPGEHKERYAVLQEKLSTGNAFQIAEAVRDMAWRRSRKGRLNTRGKRLYDEGIRFLAGEIAAVIGSDCEEAEWQIRDKLEQSLATAVA